MEPDLEYFHILNDQFHKSFHFHGDKIKAFLKSYILGPVSMETGSEHFGKVPPCELVSKCCIFSRAEHCCHPKRNKRFPFSFENIVRTKSLRRIPKKHVPNDGQKWPNTKCSYFLCLVCIFLQKSTSEITNWEVKENKHTHTKERHRSIQTYCHRTHTHTHTLIFFWKCMRVNERTEGGVTGTCWRPPTLRRSGGRKSESLPV